MAAHHEKNILAGVIIVIAVALLYVFYQNQYFLDESQEIGKYFVLSGLCLGLLLVLFYLVAGRAEGHAKAKSHTSSKKSSKKRKR